MVLRERIIIYDFGEWQSRHEGRDDPFLLLLLIYLCLNYTTCRDSIIQLTIQLTIHDPIDNPIDNP